jgi:quinol monooxygenase YgiN
MVITLIESHVKTELRDQFIEFITQHAKLCLEEPGCVNFDILEDTRDPSTFFYYEVYKDEEAHQAHMSTPHLARYRERIAEFRAEGGVNHRLRNLYPADQTWRTTD